METKIQLSGKLQRKLPDFVALVKPAKNKMTTVRCPKDEFAATSFMSDNKVLEKENIYKITAHANHKTMKRTKNVKKTCSKNLQAHRRRNPSHKKAIRELSHGVCSGDESKCEVEKKKHEFGNIGLKLPISKSFKAMRRKYISESNVRTGNIRNKQKINQLELQPMTTGKKLSSHTCRQFQEIEKTLSRSRQSCCLVLKSQVNCDVENVDFSCLVTQVPYSKKSAVHINESDIRRCKWFNLNTIGNNTKPSICNAVSPTCADMFGLDEGDPLLTYSSIANNHCDTPAVLQPSCVEKEIDTQSNTEVIRSKSDTEQMSERTNSDSCSNNCRYETAIPFGSLCQKSSPSMKLKQQRLKSMKLAIVISDSEEDLNKTIENPWILKRDVVENPVDRSSVASCQSLAFNVTTPATKQTMESGISCTLKGSDSQSSMDSFSSSALSLSEDALYFSDSEAEMQYDDIGSKKQANLRLPLATQRSNLHSMPDSKNFVSIDSLDDTDDEDDSCEFLYKKRLSRSSKKIRQSVSLGNITVKLHKPTDSYVQKGMSFDSADRKNVNASIWKRRSFDGNMQTAPCISPFIEVESTANAYSVLSPVMESGNTVTMKSNDNIPRQSEKFNTISHIRKGKAKSYQEGNQQPKKRSRIESFSKILSKRTFSIGKNDSNFQLRKEKKGDKQSFFKTHSLTSLVSKGATSLTNLIIGSGRTNSTSAINSPFIRHPKKRPSTNEQNEFVYEKVTVQQPRKRPANAQEIAAAQKRIKLAFSFSNELLPSGGLYYNDSPIFSPLTSIHSPTLLDEIMKSIEVKKISSTFCKSNDDCDSSDSDEDGTCSSKSSVNVPIYKQYSLGFDVVDLESMSLFEHGFILVSICKVCGKKQNLSDKHSTAIKEAPLMKHSASLFNLNSNCSCLHSRPRWNSITQGSMFGTIKRYRNSTDLSSERMNSMSSITHDSPRCAVKFSSCDLSSTADSTESTSEQAPFSQKLVSTSMYELRDCSPLPSLHFYEIDCSGRDSTPEQDKTFADSAQNYASFESLPGSLLRHRPIFNLSVDDIDSAAENEAIPYTDICDNLFSKSVGNLLIPHSASMLLAPLQSDEERSYSCDNLLDNLAHTEKIYAIPQSMSDTQVKKEVRKMKVKSLSSSHDALSKFAIDELGIVTSNADGVFDSDECPEDTDTAAQIRFKQCDKSLELFGLCKNRTNNLVSSSTIDKDSRDYTVHQGYCANASGKVQNVDMTCKKMRNASEFNEKETVIHVPPLEICQSCARLRKTNTIGELCHQSKGKTKPRKKLSLNEDMTILDNVCPLCKRRWTNIPKIINNKTACEKKVKSVNDLDEHVNSDSRSIGSNKSPLSPYYDPNLLSPETVFRRSHRHATRSASLSPNKSDILSTRTTKSESSRFMFSEQEIQQYAIHNSMAERLKAVSGEAVSCAGTQRKIMLVDKPLSMQCLSRLSRSQDTFQTLPFTKAVSPLTIDTLSSPVDPFTSPPLVRKFSDFPPGVATLEDCSEWTLPDDVEEVTKYDVCLGYLLHSVTCDNKTICVYSLQRNKQLMEGVITPITALPGVSHPADGYHGNKQKSHNKTKQEDMPNPAAPITIVPSDKLLHASHVLRTVLLLRASHMIRDRKFHLRTYRRCMVGTEMVDWLLQQGSLVHSRTQAVGMWQALVEEGVIVHVCHEHQFKDKYLFYRFSEDDEGVGTVPTNSSRKECEDELQDIFLMLAQIGPDAMMRMILRKLPHERTVEDLEIIYEELLHIKALSHLSTMVKRELASVLVFESHAKSGTVLFNQGDEGKSWYIILNGSVNVVIYGKGVVCTLHEGDDFGKLALVNDAPRAATIVLRVDNCHFLRVDKDDFNRILRDVEANTVRLKEHGHDVLVLEKIPSNTQSADGTVQAHYKYSIMAGTPEKMLEHLLESRLDNKGEEEIDGFLEDYLLTHVIFMPCNHLCPVLISNYHSSMSDSTEQEAFEFMLNHKKCVLHFVQEWANIVGTAFREDHTINAFLQELHSSVQEDLESYPTLKDDLSALDLVLQTASSCPDGRPKRKIGLSLAMGKKSPSKDNVLDAMKKRKAIKATDENIFKVYCADHTYSTLRLPMDTTVEQIILSIRDKLCLGDDLVLCEVKSTGERVICKENDLCVTSGLSINGFLFITPREHLDALTPLPEQEGPSQCTWNTIEMVSSKELAYHMTTYDWELFKCVQEYELIYQVFGRHKFHKITANLDLFLKRFNEIQFWVVTEMELQTNLSKRVSLLRKFIKLASYCKDFQNLNSFFAIVMGLSNIAVSRLSQTWEKLPGKFKKMFADFETLMDVSRNHRVYRLSVAKMVPPIIPFMPLLMKDMTFTHEGNKTYFDGLVNFEKMHMIAQTLKTVRFCRSSNLDLDIPGPLKSTDISGYIRNLQVIDNQRLLTQLSHKLEPRKT